VARRPLEREQVYLDGGRRTTQLMRDSLGSATSDPSPIVQGIFLLGIGPSARLQFAEPKSAKEGSV